MGEASTEKDWEIELNSPAGAVNPGKRTRRRMKNEKVYIYEKNGHRRYYLENGKGASYEVLDWRIAEEYQEAEEAIQK